MDFTGRLRVGAATANAMLITPGTATTDPVNISNTGTGPVTVQVTPTSKPFVISANAVIPTATPHPSSVIRVVGNSGDDTVISTDAYGTGAAGGGGFFVVRAAQGTPAAPAAMIANQRFGGFRGIGYGTTGYAAFMSAAIQFYAAENFTDAANGAYIRFDTTKIGTSGSLPVERMRITDAGAIQIGTPGTGSSLTITPGVAATDPVTLITSGVAPFQIGGGTQNAMMFVPGSGAPNPANLITTGTGPFQISGPSYVTVGSGGTNQMLLTPGATITTPAGISSSNAVGLRFTSIVGFNSAAPVAKPTVTGSRGGNAAVLSILAALSSYGLVTDSTTA